MKSEFLQRNADIVALLMLVDEKFSFLPELLKFFGPDTFFKFIELFAGVTITIPPKEKLETLMRNVHIWSQLSHRGAGSSADLADQYGLDRNSVYSIKTAIDTVLDSKKEELAVIKKSFHP